MLEVGYVEKRSWKKKVVVALAVVFVFFSVVRPSFAGIDLGPLLVVAKQILEVQRIANDYLNKIQKLQDQTIGRIEEVRNTIYKYTNLPSELIGKTKETLHKAERIRKRSEILFTQDFYRNGRYNTGALKDIEKWLGSIYIDEKGNVVSAKDGKTVLSDDQIKGYAMTLTQLPPNIEGVTKKIKNPTPEVKYATEVSKTQRTTLNTAVAGSVNILQDLQLVKSENERLLVDLEKGINAGELTKRQMVLIALTNKLLAMQVEMQAKQLQVESILASFYVNKRDQELYNKLKVYQNLEGK
jgi:hypothetical protein